MADKRYSNIPYPLPIPYPFIYPSFTPNTPYSSGTPDLQLHLSPITSPPPNRLSSPYSPFYPPPNTSHNKQDQAFKKRENKPIQIIDPNTKKEINFVKPCPPLGCESIRDFTDDQEIPKQEVLKIKQEFFQRIASAASKPDQLSPETKIKDEFKNKVEESLITVINPDLRPDRDSNAGHNIGHLSVSEVDQNIDDTDHPIVIEPNTVQTMIFSNSKSESENDICIDKFDVIKSVPSDDVMNSIPPVSQLVAEHPLVYPRETILQIRDDIISNPKMPNSSLESSKIFPWTSAEPFYYCSSNLSQTFQSPTVFTPKARDKVNLIEKLTWILNLITPENYEKLSKEAIDLVSTAQTKDHLENFIHCIFKKSINEPTYCEFYARLCNDMAKIFISEENSNLENQNPESKHVTFRRCLLTICQQEFEKDKDDNESLIKMKCKIEECNDNVKRNLLEEEYYIKEKQVHKHSLGNVRLIGELYRLNMLSENIIHECTVRLLKGRPTDDYLEALCRLFTVVGKDLDKPEAKDRIDQYFERIQHLMKRGFMSTRVKYLLMNLVDLRLNEWVERRENEKPKTLDELHQFDSRHSDAKSFHQQRNLSTTFHSPSDSNSDSNSVSTQSILPKFPSSHLPSLKNLNSQRSFRPIVNWSNNENTESISLKPTPISQSTSKSETKLEIPQSEIIKNSISILKEYEHLKDMDEVIQYLENLDPPSTISTVICGFFYSLNVSGGKLRFSLIELLSECLVQRLITNESFVHGVIQILVMIDTDDISEDCPLIFDFIIEVLVSLYSCQDLSVVSLFHDLIIRHFEEFCSLFIDSFYTKFRNVLLDKVKHSDDYLSVNLLAMVKLKNTLFFNDLILSLKYSQILKSSMIELKAFGEVLEDSSIQDLFSKFNVDIYIF